MRNGKKDEIRMTAIREDMMAEGFRLFAERGIESVNMKEVADACHVGIATLYRYFNVKLELVLAIGARKWEEYDEYIRVLRKIRNAEAMSAAEELEFYVDFYMELYAHHKDLLRFNQNFNSYVQHEGATEEQLQPYVMAGTSTASMIRDRKTVRSVPICRRKRCSLPQHTSCWPSVCDMPRACSMTGRTRRTGRRNTSS